MRFSAYVEGLVSVIEHADRALPYPTVTDPEAPLLRPERHIPNSVATMCRRLVVALVRTLSRCRRAVPIARYARRKLSDAGRLRKWKNCVFQALFIWVGSVSAAQSAACVIIPAIQAPDGLRYYIDIQSSIIDQELFERDRAIDGSLRDFMINVEQALDSRPIVKADADCAYARLLEWAQQGALLTAPYRTSNGDVSAALVRRQQYALGFTIIAIKLRAANYDVSGPISNWIARLNHLVFSWWERLKFRNNLYTWSGVNAAALALLTEDKWAKNYAADAWRYSINHIGVDGFIESELKRGRRALMYHQYTLSGLMMFRQVRHAIGLAESKEDAAAIKRLSEQVGRSLCDGSQIARLAGAVQEMPDQIAYRIPAVFGQDLLTDDWKKCGLAPPDLMHVVFGGRLDLTASALVDARR